MTKKSNKDDQAEATAHALRLPKHGEAVLVALVISVDPGILRIRHTQSISIHRTGKDSLLRDLLDLKVDQVVLRSSVRVVRKENLLRLGMFSFAHQIPRRLWDTTSGDLAKEQRTEQADRDAQGKHAELEYRGGGLKESWEAPRPAGRNVETPEGEPGLER